MTTGATVELIISCWAGPKIMSLMPMNSRKDCCQILSASRFMGRQSGIAQEEIVLNRVGPLAGGRSGV